MGRIIINLFNCTILILIAPQLLYAQFESEEISVALDNTKYKCTSRDLVVRNDTFTKGNTSVGYATPRPNGVTSEITCEIFGANKVTFDWRLDQFRATDRIEFQYLDRFGRDINISVLDKNSSWATVTELVPEEAFFIRWTFWDQGGDAWVDNLRVVEVNPYSAALDNYNIDVFSIGDQPFSTTTAYKTKGDKSVVSGFIDHNETSILYTIASGGQILRFDWKVSSELRNDGLIFYFLDLDGNIVGEITSISGESEWRPVRLDIPGKGDHFLVWLYVKNQSISSGADQGWIDNLRIGGNSNGFLPVILNLLEE